MNTTNNSTDNEFNVANVTTISLISVVAFLHLIHIVLTFFISKYHMTGAITQIDGFVQNLVGVVQQSNQNALLKPVTTLLDQSRVVSPTQVNPSIH